ncbi:hypothetical protein EVAR_15855_1 [Eumeta japonica]|uniref:Uncharacterized protein n=1 Tax=Eumeta variegata TaxID=151549 RepID=A0A4C1UE90_EUMVA|nr:hypothetical protein EVAR_15855_1 [Eumeta japonica]
MGVSAPARYLHRIINLPNGKGSVPCYDIRSVVATYVPCISNGYTFFARGSPHTLNCQFLELYRLLWFCYGVPSFESEETSSTAFFVLRRQYLALILTAIRVSRHPGSQSPYDVVNPAAFVDGADRPPPRARPGRAACVLIKRQPT